MKIFLLSHVTYHGVTSINNLIDIASSPEIIANNLKTGKYVDDCKLDVSHYRMRIHAYDEDDALHRDLNSNAEEHLWLRKVSIIDTLITEDVKSNSFTMVMSQSDKMTYIVESLLLKYFDGKIYEKLDLYLFDKEDEDKAIDKLADKMAAGHYVDVWNAISRSQNSIT